MKAIAAVVLLVLTGCSTRTIEWNGIKYKLNSFGVKSQIGEIEFRQGTNSLVVKGYQSDQVQAIGVAVEKAVTAGVKAAKP